jgi:diguanylate cyclase (GGDEF)-like protein
LWFAAAIGFTPLVVILAVQSTVDLSIVPLVLSTIAAIMIGSTAVVALARPQRQDAQALASPSRVQESLPPEEESRDPLTGLPTFQPFSQRLLAEYERAQRDGGETAVVLADISQLVLINDEFGHEAGDQALAHVASCLANTKRGNDIVARVGDDEFALLLPDCGRQGAEGFVKRAQSWLAKEDLRVSSNNRKYTLWIGICAGIAVCDGTAATADESLTAAIESLRLQREERDMRRPRWTEAA